ncbi:DNA repair protein RecO [Tahibacter amnicola]|uniref:DNA repair protein RecO n=1 Tax=Tahibacter amnicola TaxID=2976241 RepID=A0ABY6BI30_9GAMM|nr:DNA repair protein RecO [Tahibacter amnicola]UXI69666.1 DNA repair protein RecO [Tahibacter amnicola]
MRIDDQPGWILHARPYRETSVLLECLSREFGRVGLVARGVRKDKPRQPRALLQAFAPVSFSWAGQGELATLVGVDARGQPPVLQGEALMCGMYVNELVIRLVQRQDPLPDLFDCYESTLYRLAQPLSRPWTLRRFERDLLSEIGYGVAAEEADTGDELDAEADYAYVPEHGAVRWANQPDALRLRGSALLALIEDSEPHPRDLATLRLLMRALISHQLGGASLRSWSLLAPPSRQDSPSR